MELLEMIAGASGAVVIFMGVVKSAWNIKDPKKKWMYWIPSTLASLGAGYIGIVLLLGMPFLLLQWLFVSGLIFSFELLVQNGWWGAVKKHVPDIIDFLGTVFKK